MNQTKISNVMARGGVEGWTQERDGDHIDVLTKTFEFDSFEQASHFV